MLMRLKSSLAVLCCVLASYGWSAERVALLIANQDYDDARLYKPLQDVKLIENSLKKLGFVVRVVSDADQKQMQRALRDFGDNAKGAEVAFFYYSGHGLQSNGENYLVPLHASIQKESDIGIEAVATNGLLRQLEEARPKVAVVVLDACRDNPWLTSRGGKGLGRIDSPAGTLVAFATSPNKTAADEGLYAQYLAQYLLEPNVELRKVFDKVGGQIDKATQGKQRPRKDDGLYEDVYLNGKASTQVVERIVEKPVERIVERERVVVQENPQAAEISYWNSIKNSNNKNDYQAYLSQYPNGLFVEMAQTKLQSKVEVAQVQVRNKPTPYTSNSGLSRMSWQPTKSRVGIFYSTASGTTGMDGQGFHSPFAQSLLNHITEPLTWLQLVDKVRDETNNATEGKQNPDSSGDIQYDFVLSDTKQPHKFALIIGNSSYKDSPLKNPVNDALEVEKKLKEVGFNTTIILNGKYKDTLNAINSFRDKLTRGSVGVVYYAGHTAQVYSRNYLVPVDADIQQERDIEFKTIDIDEQISNISQSNNAHTLLFIFDASRDNDFARASR